MADAMANSAYSHNESMEPLTADDQVITGSHSPVLNPNPSGMTSRTRASAAITLAAFVALLVAIWGGISPFVGPIFGYSPDGSSAWTWNLAHALLGLVPGIAASIAALYVIVRARRFASGRSRILLRVAGFLSLLAGGWFILGPIAWPVLEGSNYFVAGSWGLLIRELGFSVGPGILLAAFGGYTLGWNRLGQSVRNHRYSPMRVPVIEQPA